MFCIWWCHDKNKLPKNFVKLFELDLTSPDIENQVKNVFQRARLLDKDHHSGRIVFIDDKIVIFRNEEIVVHKETEGLTKAEKKRSKIVSKPINISFKDKNKRKINFIGFKVILLILLKISSSKSKKINPPKSIFLNF